MSNLLRATIVAHGLATAWLGWRTMDDRVATVLGENTWMVLGALFVMYMVPTILTVIIVTFLSRFSFRLADREQWIPGTVSSLLTPVLVLGLATHVGVAFIRQSGGGPEAGFLFAVPLVLLGAVLARSGRFGVGNGIVAGAPTTAWLVADAAILSFGTVA